MPASTMMPDVTVSIAFGTTPNDPAPAWVEVSGWLEAADTITISRGRADELTETPPNTMTLTLDNSDGRFTPQRAASPYYPNVKKSRRIRVSTRWPLGTDGNFVANPSFEADASGWQSYGAAGGYPYVDGSTVARSVVRAWTGAASGLITWPAAPGAVAFAGTGVTGLVIGKTYTASAYVYVVTGQPAVQVAVAGGAASAASAVNDAWTRLTLTFTATASTHGVGVCCSAPVAGNTCYVDGLMVDEGSAAGVYTATPPPITHRFTGFIDEWSLLWHDGTDAAATARVTATSRQARLAKGAELRSIIEAEYLADAPKAYYPFGDNAGTTRAGNVAVTAAPSMAVIVVGTGGTIVFGSAIGPATDSLTAAQYTRVSWANGNYMQVLFAGDVVTPTDASLLIECFFSTSTTGNQMALLSVDDGTLGKLWYLTVDTAGHLVGGCSQSLALSGTMVSAATNAANGATHHAALRVTATTPTTVTLTLYLDGAVVGTATSAIRFSSVVRMVAGGLHDPPWNGVLAHVAVYGGPAEISSARIAQHAASGLTGFTGERSDQRIARLASYGGVPAAEVVTETGLSVSLAAQDTTGQQPIALMRAVAKSENGVLFDSGAGNVVFHSRSHRYNVASALTLSAASQEIESSLLPKLDDQGLANDITVTQAAGVDTRVVDSASVTDYGTYRDTLDLLVTDDNEVTDAANWSLRQRSVPLIRIPDCTLDLLNMSTTQKQVLLGVEIGSRITLAGLPAQAPSPTADFFVEGVTETLGAESYLMTLNLSPADLTGIWLLDSATLSLLDTTTRLGY